MPKWTMEVLIGFAAAFVIFLGLIGVNIMPIAVMALIGVGIFAVLQMRGGLAVGAAQDRKRKKQKPEKFTFEQIGGQDNSKQELREALDFLIKHEEIKKLGIRPLKGILLTGPPGTGKTLMAKAAAHYTDSVFVAASGSDFVEMYVGVGAGRIRDLFKDARTRAAQEKKQSAIIFIDEIDVIGGKREGGQQREYDQTLNQLLTEMDGIYNNDEPRILVIAATNRKEMLDAALLRPGRFDRHIQVDLPDKKGRKHILELHAKSRPVSPDADLDRIAEEAYGFSGAQLESVMNEAAIYAMRDKQAVIDQKHLSRAIDKVMLGEKTDRETSADEKRRVAIHELGHAIMAEVLRPGSVSQVALSPRGQALGYVRHNPQKEQYLYTKQFLEEQIMIALAGSAAEELYYGGRSTGSRGDFEQALDLVENMIVSGLTDLGIVSLKMLTKEELMKHNDKILRVLTESTRNELDRYRKVFEGSLDILMHEEVLSGEQFRAQFRELTQLPA
ncbi:AAA family ATPase [Saccharibacillus endophyticus]|uniref:Microtubule-severing ATPase n=1 Tax=Saccharibacillus endophyticus TaxID=2060666 RepID=A0ABQ1ZMZ0_9BACL|nr:AAA family ATPase [Saccharibacillus endophyticus]GGH72020.1 microtubule-severing ATPase [Saccharibacillus endophyticus]